MTLLLSLSLFSQTYISGGITSAKYIAEESTGVKSETGFRFGIKFFPSESFLVDIEYISFNLSVSQRDFWEDYSATYEFGHNYIALSPKIKIPINERVYLAIGAIAALHVKSDVKYSEDYEGEKYSDSEEIENMAPFLVLGSGEIGINITERILLIGYYDYGFTNIYEDTDNAFGDGPDLSLGAVGAKIAISF